MFRLRQRQVTPYHFQVVFVSPLIRVTKSPLQLVFGSTLSTPIRYQKGGDHIPHSLPLFSAFRLGILALLGVKRILSPLQFVLILYPERLLELPPDPGIRDFHLHEEQLIQLVISGVWLGSFVLSRGEIQC